jgi:hypothetical protein
VCETGAIDFSAKPADFNVRFVSTLICCGAAHAKIRIANDNIPHRRSVNYPARLLFIAIRRLKEIASAVAGRAEIDVLHQNIACTFELDQMMIFARDLYRVALGPVNPEIGFFRVTWRGVVITEKLQHRVVSVNEFACSPNLDRPGGAAGSSLVAEFHEIVVSPVLARRFATRARITRRTTVRLAADKYRIEHEIMRINHPHSRIRETFG